MPVPAMVTTVMLVYFVRQSVRTFSHDLPLNADNGRTSASLPAGASACGGPAPQSGLPRPALPWPRPLAVQVLQARSR